MVSDDNNEEPKKEQKNSDDSEHLTITDEKKEDTQPIPSKTEKLQQQDSTEKKEEEDGPAVEKNREQEKMTRDPEITVNPSKDAREKLVPPSPEDEQKKEKKEQEDPQVPEKKTEETPEELAKIRTRIVGDRVQAINSEGDVLASVKRTSNAPAPETRSPDNKEKEKNSTTQLPEKLQKDSETKKPVEEEKKKDEPPSSESEQKSSSVKEAEDKEKNSEADKEKEESDEDEEEEEESEEEEEEEEKKKEEQGEDGEQLCNAKDNADREQARREAQPKSGGRKKKRAAPKPEVRQKAYEKRRKSSEGRAKSNANLKRGRAGYYEVRPGLWEFGIFDEDVEQLDEQGNPTPVFYFGTDTMDIKPGNMIFACDCMRLQQKETTESTAGIVNHNAITMAVTPETLETVVKRMVLFKFQQYTFTNGPASAGSPGIVVDFTGTEHLCRFPENMKVYWNHTWESNIDPEGAQHVGYAVENKIVQPFLVGKPDFSGMPSYQRKVLADKMAGGKIPNLSVEIEPIRMMEQRTDGTFVPVTPYTISSVALVKEGRCSDRDGCGVMFGIVSPPSSGLSAPTTTTTLQLTAEGAETPRATNTLLFDTENRLNGILLGSYHEEPMENNIVPDSVEVKTEMTEETKDTRLNDLETALKDEYIAQITGVMTKYSKDELLAKSIPVLKEIRDVALHMAVKTTPAAITATLDAGSAGSVPPRQDQGNDPNTERQKVLFSNANYTGTPDWTADSVKFTRMRMEDIDYQFPETAELVGKVQMSIEDVRTLIQNAAKQAQKGIGAE